ncbi:MAG: glycosyltransferase, partial [Dehalococcoidales bacterium]|nr:glycosyltransferase [Dehalococcoidales bacterium]
PLWYNAAELFVYPSLYEGFGFPPLEAMACGTPVVVSRSSSLPEVVGDAGLLVTAAGPAEMAEAMHFALTNRELHTSLSERGLARAGQFSWEAAARATLAVYRDAAD